VEHSYLLRLTWQGNRGPGTTGYRDYGREVLLESDGKPAIDGSADKPFRGDPARWNPEEMLVAALGQCHLLSYLHIAVVNDVVVTAYSDEPVGTMTQEGIGGRFTRVLLRPQVTVASPDMVETARRIHQDAHEACFIAASVNFPVDIEPVVIVAPGSRG